MKYQSILTGVSLCVALASCQQPAEKKDIIADNITFATEQVGRQVDIIEKSGKVLNPRTLDEQGNVHYVHPEDWTSGFFPGSMWYMYELTGDNKWADLGRKYTEDLDSVKFLKWHHDVGFMINCSFGNGLRLTNNEAYKDVLVQAAQSLATRFRPGAGVIQSWDADRGWQGKRGWECPVIIDNMMNLELMFNASHISGDPTYRNIAISHADVTLANHFRDDNSCFHVIDYDLETGAVRHKHTAQGYAHESAWARGQAWAIYGYTVCYRETKDPKYLAQAENVYEYLMDEPNMPADLVPYWDFDAPKIPNEPRDASAASIIASALYEMSTYVANSPYKATADRIVESLSSDAYRAKAGENGNFILMHSVGSIPHNNEIDVPLNYADYYFLEALARKRDLESNQPLDLTPIK